MNAASWLARFRRRCWTRALEGIALLAIGCHPESTDCMDGDDGRCIPESACTRLAFTCDHAEVTIHTVRSSIERPRGAKADAARGDLVLSNGIVTAVLGAVGTSRRLAPSGGDIVDFSAMGLNDELNGVFQAFGILPDDSVRYTSVTELDNEPLFVAAVFRGKLDLRPDIEVVTRYELRGCEPGLRVRTEIYHGGRDPLALFPADAFFWGDRGVTPFVPLPGQGG